MYFYSVSTGCYSDNYEIILTSEKEYSENDFLNLINKVCEDLIKRDNYISYAEDIVKILINEHDFKKLKYLNCHAFDYSYGKERFYSLERDLPIINIINGKDE